MVREFLEYEKFGETANRVNIALNKNKDKGVFLLNTSNLPCTYYTSHRLKYYILLKNICKKYISM